MDLFKESKSLSSLELLFMFDPCVIVYNLPTGSLRVVAVVGHEMVETQGVGVEQILVLDFATAGVGQDLLEKYK